VSLLIHPGELVSLLGPSGCGKTTLLRSLAGLETIDSGSIRIDDEDIATVPVNRRDIGMVFQSYSLFPHLTVTENVEFGLRMRRIEARSRARRAAEVLDLVGLADKGSRYAHELSGGQQQRVALARALVTRPRVLLLDEPLSALDAKVRVQLREQIRAIQRDLGITTVFVTHDQEEALAVSDRIAVMDAGRIAQIGVPEELYRHPSTPRVAEFIGLSSVVPGEVQGDGVWVWGVRLPLQAPAPGGASQVFLRPENVRMAPAATALSGAGIDGTVIESAFLGSFRRTAVRTVDDSVVQIQHPSSERVTAGDEVWLTVLPEPVLVRTGQ
jgi:putative spermidine/putrescine transport system ATP-binding protein